MLAAAALATLCLAQEEPRKYGHSSHGSAFDAGLRTRPWEMKGIGEVNFPITTSHPEVQKWFNQGVALLHSYWYEEAERSFRWCMALDPECAMAYWGMAASGLGQNAPGGPRFREFLRIAVEKKANATRREQMWIDAYAEAYLDGGRRRYSIITSRFQELTQAYPDDLEAKAFLAGMTFGRNRVQHEALIDQILDKQPNHPGAHHYRIHNWDGRDNSKALPSCAEYGDIAPGIGHAQHMPGHVYSKVGMWKEAARHMDAATRVELVYMRDRLKLPFETWNFAHNRNYLCYIQENLGMGEAAIRGARAMMEAPLDPNRNPQRGYGAYSQGRQALIRALVSFERWDELLEIKPTSSSNSSKMWNAYYRLLAHAARQEGELAEKALAEYDEARQGRNSQYSAAARALVLEAKGDLEGAADAWERAVTTDSRNREQGRYADDPPSDAFPMAQRLADCLLRLGKYEQAASAARQALDLHPGSGFAYSILAQAHHALGEESKARRYAGLLKDAWSEADEGLRWITAVEALNLGAEPVSEAPRPERPYTLETNREIGPLEWSAYPAPELNVRSIDGEQVRLSDYRGRNVILIYYLSDECVHCMEQLADFGAKAEEFRALGTELLAVSSASPQQNKESVALAELPFTLLSDSADHANARRFDSYDDFEDMELHSTFLIDGEGNIRWKRTGGDPFENVDFVLGEIRRMRG